MRHKETRQWQRSQLPPGLQKTVTDKWMPGINSYETPWLDADHRPTHSCFSNTNSSIGCPLPYSDPLDARFQRLLQHPPPPTLCTLPVGKLLRLPL